MNQIVEQELMYSTTVYVGDELTNEFEHLYPDTEMLAMIGIMESRHVPDVEIGEEVPGVRVVCINRDSNTVVYDETTFTLKGRG